MGTLTISNGVATIDGERVIYSQIDHIKYGIDRTTAVVIGPRPQADRDAQLLRDRLGWEVTVAPDTQYGSAGQIQVFEDAEGNRTMTCPVCENPATDVSRSAGQTIRYCEDPKDQQLAALGYSGHLLSQRTRVMSWRYEFQPCGDALIV